MHFFSVKNFDKLQHYKDRSPPWIKLYNELLDDYQFCCLPDASKMHLIAIMLLASRSANKIPYDSEWVGKRISATEQVDLDLLLKRGFIEQNQLVPMLEQVASTTLALCLPREREEREKRREESCAVAKAPRTKNSYSEEFETKFWNPYPRTPNMSKLETWKAWVKLTSEDQNLACQAIERYKRFLATKPNLETVHACRFLSQRRFDSLLAAPAQQSHLMLRSFV